jgi:hypothetical protein
VYPLHAKKWRGDLSLISKYDLHLDKFEYEVKGLEHICEERVGDVPAWKFVQGSLAKEVERVGKQWVGEKGKFETKVVKKRELHFRVWESTLEWKFTYAKSKAYVRSGWFGDRHGLEMSPHHSVAIY